jgi:hypothetical protein
VGVDARGDDGRCLVVDRRVFNGGRGGIAVKAQQVGIVLAPVTIRCWFNVSRRFDTFLSLSGSCQQARKFKPPEQGIHSGGLIGFFNFVQPGIINNPGKRPEPYGRIKT